MVTFKVLHNPSIELNCSFKSFWDAFICLSVGFSPFIIMFLSLICKCIPPWQTHSNSQISFLPFWWTKICWSLITSASLVIAWSLLAIFWVTIVTFSFNTCNLRCIFLQQPFHFLYKVSPLNFSMHDGTSKPPCTRSLLYRQVTVIMQVIKPLLKNDHNNAEYFLGRCPTTTWSFVTAIANELWGLCLSCLHKSFSPSTGAQIDWYWWNPRTAESNSYADTAIEGIYWKYTK